MTKEQRYDAMQGMPITFSFYREDVDEMVAVTGDVKPYYSLRFPTIDLARPFVETVASTMFNTSVGIDIPENYTEDEASHTLLLCISNRIEKLSIQVRRQRKFQSYNETQGHRECIGYKALSYIGDTIRDLIEKTLENL